MRSRETPTLISYSLIRNVIRGKTTSKKLAHLRKLSSVGKIIMLRTPTPKWKSFHKIYYLRKRGLFRKTNYIKRRLFADIFNRFTSKFRGRVIHSRKLLIFNYGENFYKAMKNLRYDFKNVFLRISKKHTKIRTFIKSQKIIEHPSPLSFKTYFFTRNAKLKLFFLQLPLPVYRFTPKILLKWQRYNGRVIWKYGRLKKTRFRYDSFFNYISKYHALITTKYSREEEYSSGACVDLELSVYNRPLSVWLLWPIHVKVLYWRLYAM